MAIQRKLVKARDVVDDYIDGDAKLANTRGSV
jgi:hypothetical protein